MEICEIKLTKSTSNELLGAYSSYFHDRTVSHSCKHNLNFCFHSGIIFWNLNM